jgi:reductive dehalogenase
MSILGTRKFSVGAPGYSVNEEYVRFNQKNNMIYQGEWNRQRAHLGDDEWYRSRADKVRNKTPGFARLDWAYYSAMVANLAASDYVINRANAGGTSWSPINRSGLYKNIEDLPQWGCEPAKAGAILKSLARTLGADDVGVCLLDRRWVYSHYYDRAARESFPIRFNDENGYEKYDKPGLVEDKSLVIPAKMKYVLVVIHEMEREGIATAPTLTHMATTWHSYSKIGFTTQAVAEFVRALGYHAIPSANDTALNIPLAIDAGLGELGRNAKLIHPLFGPRCRISKIITDLPLLPDTPISFGVTAFCDSCKKCAKKCPVDAIPLGERSYEPAGEFNSRGVLCWQMNHARCREFWVRAGTNCGLCIQSCPYNKPKGALHWLVKSVISTLPALNSAIVYADDLLGYGKPLPSVQFWQEFSGRHERQRLHSE